jgi:hypothetical protein
MTIFRSFRQGRRVSSVRSYLGVLGRYAELADPFRGDRGSLRSMAICRSESTYWKSDFGHPVHRPLVVRESPMRRVGFSWSRLRIRSCCDGVRGSKLFSWEVTNPGSGAAELKRGPRPGKIRLVPKRNQRLRLTAMTNCSPVAWQAAAIPSSCSHKVGGSTYRTQEVREMPHVTERTHTRKRFLA